MSKSELLNWLHDQYREWQSLLDKIGTKRMDEAGVSGDWSMKDIISHMSIWTRWVTVRMRAALAGEPEPAPPWPAELKTDDEINGWIHTYLRGRTPAEVLDESHLAFQDYLTVIEGLPDDAKVARVDPGYYLVWIGDKKFRASEFFDHFRDEHEPDVRAWLARTKK